jgi:hypothetical protein
VLGGKFRIVEAIGQGSAGRFSRRSVSIPAALKIDAVNPEAQAGARRARQAGGAQKNNARP